MIHHKSFYRLLFIPVLIVMSSTGGDVTARELTDSNWVRINIGEYPGTNGVIHAVTHYKGIIYVGGHFTTAGNVKAGYVAQWNGTSWRPLGSGIALKDGVYALACDSSGNLYAGGYFDTAGGIPAKNIAKWNGKEWSSLGEGADNTVLALACDDAGVLYAGGCFSSIGGINAAGIAQWDGKSWSSLGGGTEHSAVYAVTCRGSSVYIGGVFDSVGNMTMPRIAKWDGNSWSPLGEPFKPSKDAFNMKSVKTLAFDNAGNLYAGGQFDSIAGVEAHNIAKWDGVSWRGVGMGLGSSHNNIEVSSLVFDSKGMLYAGGGFYSVGDNVPVHHVARWNGNFWYSLGSGLDSAGFTSALAVDETGGLIICGSFNTISGTPAYNIARWNGSSGTAMGSGIDGIVTTLAVDETGKLAVGGRFSTIGGQYSGQVAEWNNGTWHSLDSGLIGTVNALAYGMKGNLFAAGSRMNKSIGGSSYNVAALRQWDGKKWSVIGDYKNLICYTLVSKNNADVFVGGYSFYADSYYDIAKFNGSNLSSLSSGLEIRSWDHDPYVKAVAVDSSGILFAGGLFDLVDSVDTKNIARWDGISWQPLGKGLNGEVTALAFSKKGILYAGGYFDTVGVPVKRIAGWDGSSWDSLTSGVNGRINALACDDSGVLYVGGKFDTAGGIPVNNIAKWDGKSWSSVGSGTDDEVRALVVYGSTLYVGGDFKSVGDKMSPGVAAVSLYGDTRTARNSHSVLHTPKPIFLSSGNVIQCKNIPKSGTISLFSIAGRKLCTVKGKSWIDVSGIAGQQLIVRCKGTGKTVTTGMVLKK